jgi:hypothetical protein
MESSFRKKYVPELVYLLFVFPTQKAENCKMLSEKSAKINAESKKLSEPYQ